MHKSLIGALALAVVASAASAADLPARAGSYAPYYSSAPVSDWTGFYVGGTIGYGWGNASSSAALPFGLGAYSGGSGMNGVVGGATAGYNYQWGNIVVGLEGDLNLGSQKGAGSQTFNVGSWPFTFPVTATQTASLDWFGTVRGRLGYDLNGWLLYGTGGWAFGKATVTGNASVFGFPIANFSDSRNVSGYAYGGGVEKRLAGNWSVKAEYLHMDFRPFDTQVSTLAGPVTMSNKLKDDIVRVGLNYRF